VFGFSAISKHRYMAGNKDIGTHAQTHLGCKKLLYYPININRNSNPKLFHSCSQNLSLSNGTRSLLLVLSLLLPHLTPSISLFSITVAVNRHHLFSIGLTLPYLQQESPLVSPSSSCIFLMIYV